MRLGLALIAATAGAAGLGCGLNQQGISPPTNQIFFPGAIKIDRSTDAPNQPNHWLYVANSNSDLRYNDGTLVVVDIAKAASDHDSDPDHTVWGPCPTIGYVHPSSDPTLDFCCWDLLDENILDCDERGYINGDSTVKIGSFSSAIQAQTVLTGAAGATQESTLRLLVGVRGNSSITVVDTAVSPDSVALSCTACPTTFGECDGSHIVNVVSPTPVNQITASATVAMPPEPYAVVIDPTVAPAPMSPSVLSQQLLYVGHLVGGFLSLVDLTIPSSGPNLSCPSAPPPLLGLPHLIDVIGSIFPPDPNGSQGVTSLTVKTPGVGGAVYATSRFLPKAGSFAAISLASPPSSSPPTDTDVLANTGDTFDTSLPGSETRGIQFIPGEERAFVLQRNPPALVGFDTSVPGINTPTDVIELCDSPIFLNMPTVAGSELPLRLYVTCFNAGEVYVIDPYVPRLVAIIEVGRGPAGLDFAVPIAGDATSERAYVNGFAANNVSVIDLQPGSPTENHVIQRIGFPSAVPR